LPVLVLIEGNQQVATKPDESLSPSLFNLPAATSTPAIAPTVSAATPTSRPVGDSQERTIVVENALYRLNCPTVARSWKAGN